VEKGEEGGNCINKNCLRGAFSGIGIVGAGAGQGVFFLLGWGWGCADSLMR